MEFAVRIEQTTRAEDRFECLMDLPPSAKLVYKVLEVEGQLTQSQLAEETLLSKRTIRYALAQLETADIVTEDIYFPDARKKLYQPKPVTRPE